MAAANDQYAGRWLVGFHIDFHFAAIWPQLTITANTYIVVVTRNVLVDQEILPRLVSSHAPYIGVMGSRRRWAETQRLLLAAGLPEADLTRFHSPIGLELKAEDPQEIAISIMAEIIQFRRTKPAP